MPRESIEYSEEYPEEDFEYDYYQHFVDRFEEVRLMIQYLDRFYLYQLTRLNNKIKDKNLETEQYDRSVKTVCRRGHLEIVQLVLKQDNRLSVKVDEKKKITNKIKSVPESQEYKYKKVSKLSQKGANRSSQKKNYRR